MRDGSENRHRRVQIRERWIARRARKFFEPYLGWVLVLSPRELPSQGRPPVIETSPNRVQCLAPREYYYNYGGRNDEELTTTQASTKLLTSFQD